MIGLGAAIDYLNGLDRMGALQHETDLLVYATEQLGSIEGLQIWGQAPDKASVLSFTIDGIHPHDMSTFLNADGIAIRAGHHCTQPLLKRFGLPATARASFSFYNTFAEVDRLRAGILKLKQFFFSQMPAVSDLYQSVILEHSKRPQHYGALSQATHSAERL